MPRRRLQAESEPSIADAIGAAKQAALGIAPEHAKAIAGAVILNFVGRFGTLANWLYRRYGEERVEKALNETIDEFAENLLR